MSALGTITSAELVAVETEIRRELAERRRVYPGRVATGAMLQRQADHEIDVAKAWLEDIARVRACWFCPPWSPPANPDHGLAWTMRRSGLLREITLRRRFFPAWIDKGKLTPAQAEHRLTCLERLLEIYEDGWDWLASNGRRGDVSRAATDPLEAAAFAEFQAIRAERDARQVAPRPALTS